MVYLRMDGYVDMCPPPEMVPWTTFGQGVGAVIATPSNQIMHAPLYEVPKWQIPWHLYHE